jgi:hypothetical protein
MGEVSWHGSLLRFISVTKPYPSPYRIAISPTSGLYRVAEGPDHRLEWSRTPTPSYYAVFLL